MDYLVGSWRERGAPRRRPIGHLTKRAAAEVASSASAGRRATAGARCCWGRGCLLGAQVGGDEIVERSPKAIKRDSKSLALVLVGDFKLPEFYWKYNTAERKQSRRFLECMEDNFLTQLQCFRALCCKGPPPPRPEYDLVCIGLTGSGKTSLLSQLCSESPENIVSTTGTDNIRKYWSRYYQGSQGVIFVLDSASSEDDLETARNELHSALQHPQLCTLPFLILANHQDKPAARSIQEVR
ncbi:ADP-ribosylation factor-like protein 15 [Opisthocomus hoazin]|uniref:ADP-ribosylation factor-like protein 15 n=1 Tax=Opisthocomus hoazin TaxID=30419 RepID=UPI003F52E28D